MRGRCSPRGCAARPAIAVHESLSLDRFGSTLGADHAAVPHAARAGDDGSIGVGSDVAPSSALTLLGLAPPVETQQTSSRMPHPRTNSRTTPSSIKPSHGWSITASGGRHLDQGLLRPSRSRCSRRANRSISQTARALMARRRRCGRGLLRQPVGRKRRDGVDQVLRRWQRRSGLTARGRHGHGDRARQQFAACAARRRPRARDTESNPRRATSLPISA